MACFRPAGVCVLIAGICLSPAAHAQIQWRSGAGVAAGPGSDRLQPLREAAAAGDRHVIIHLREVAGLQLQTTLKTAGVTPRTWLGSNAYFAVVGPQGADVPALSRVPELVSFERIQRDWKLHPMLAAGQTPEWALVPAPGGAPSPEPWVAGYLMFHEDVAEQDGLAVALTRGARVISRLRSVNGLVIEIPLSGLTDLADDDAVMYVEPALPPLIELNDSNRVITQADIVQAAPYGLTGAGVNVLVYDGGFARATHVDFGGRLFVRDTSGLSNHATHVCGTIGGAGVANSAFRGMAPDVTIQSYGFEQPGGLQQGFLYTDPGDLEADYGSAINLHGAVLSNNSIGTNTAANGFPCSWEGDYGVTSALIDAVVRGSLGSPIRVVWANGNERSGGRCGTTYHTTAPPACAKNHITVGALQSNNDAITPFTSWGPTDDGRLKPDISAPGCQVGGDSGVTSCASSSNTAYATLCGTSMASPTVCGLSALLIQDYRARFPARPELRNATLKVLLAHNAQDIDAAGPDYKSGYGSVRIQRTIDFMRTGQFAEEQVSHGGVYRATLAVAPGTPELKVTLAWDDPPAAPAVVGAIVNDLDIVVLDPSGTQHYPWTLGGVADPAAPAVRTAPDRVNNIEQVLVSNPVSGAWVLEIRGFSVPVGPQAFSVCYTPAASQDCNNNGVNDLDDIAGGTSLDCNQNLLPDECESQADCNNNGALDICDLFNGASLDRNNNRIPDECDPDCNQNGTPDDWDVSTGLSPDCNANGQPDECDVAGGVSADCDSNGRPDECDVDCNNNDIPDACDIANGVSQDCNNNGVPDECGADCNQNGRADECDVAQGTSPDCNVNGIPDECEPPTDCNSNGVRDFCDIAGGASNDVNANGIPDECEPDCNGNGVPDSWDISIGASPDCNSNNQPDECDVANSTSLDCNHNAVPDECDVASGTAPDCNGNGAPDACDIAGGVALDCNANAVPDECDVADGTSPDCNANGVPDGCDVGGAQVGDCNANGVPDECDVADGTAPDCNSNAIPDACDIAGGHSQDCNGNNVPDSCEDDCNLNGIADECDIASGFSQDANHDGFPDECTRLYVNDNASGNGRGANWNNAFTSLADALEMTTQNLGVREVWVAAGTYRPSAGTTYALRPGVALYGGFNGTETIITQRNVSANVSFLGFAGLGNFAHVITMSAPDTNTLVDGFTIRGALGSGSTVGGGIWVQGGTALVRNCILQGNFSGSGGGAFVQNGSATFENCRFTENVAQTGDGGAIGTGGTGQLTLINCRFDGNYSRETGGGMGRGGAVYNAAGFTLNVSRCTFEFNRALNFSRLARAEGGGIANYSSNATIRECTFLRGEAAVGGGVCSATPITILNSLFSGNKAIDPNDLAADAGEGGGVFAEPGVAITLHSCTLAANWAEKKAAGISADAVLRNCILWNNTVLVDAGDNPEPLVDQQFQGDVDIRYCNIAGLLNGGGPDPNFPGSIEASPLFTAPPNMTAAGVFTAGDLHLRPNSPCLDAGENAAIPAGVTTDLDGLPRRFDDPVPDTGLGAVPVVDLGPFERQPPPCFGDMDGNRSIDAADMNLLLGAIGSSGPNLPADLNADGRVDMADIARFQALYGTACP